MLILSRRMGEEIVIDGNIRVVVLETQRNRVRLGVAAPPSVRVNRLEVHLRDEAQNPMLVPASASAEPASPRFA